MGVVVLLLQRLSGFDGEALARLSKIMFWPRRGFLTTYPLVLAFDVAQRGSKGGKHREVEPGWRLEDLLVAGRVEVVQRFLKSLLWRLPFSGQDFTPLSGEPFRSLVRNGDRVAQPVVELDDVSDDRKHLPIFCLAL